MIWCTRVKSGSAPKWLAAAFGRVRFSKARKLWPMIRQLALVTFRKSMFNSVL